MILVYFTDNFATLMIIGALIVMMAVNRKLKIPATQYFYVMIAVILLSARSALFIITSLGLSPTSSSISGLRLDFGILASIISAAASQRERFSLIILSAFAIWPGNQFMFWD